MTQNKVSHEPSQTLDWLGLKKTLLKPAQTLSIPTIKKKEFTFKIRAVKVHSYKKEEKECQ
jgi:hypothetical protein